MVLAVRIVKRAHKMLTIDQKLELLDQIGKKSYTVLWNWPFYNLRHQEDGVFTLTVQAQDKRYGGEAASQGNEAWEG